jgi:hypothetical protein
MDSSVDDLLSLYSQCEGSGEVENAEIYRDF